MNQPLPSPTGGPVPGPRSRRLSLRWVFFALVLIGLAALFWWWSRQKSVGTTTVQPPSQESASPTAQSERFEGRLAAFAYPAGFERRGEAEVVQFPILERAIFSRSDVEGRKLVFLVQDITHLSLDEYASYRMRAMDKEAYQKHEATINGKQITFFLKDTTVFEAGAFWQEGERAYSLVLSSPFRSHGLGDELEQILQTLEYQTED